MFLKHSSERFILRKNVQHISKIALLFHLRDHCYFLEQVFIFVDLIILGFVSTGSRLVIGFIADLPCMNKVYLCNLLLMTNGVLVVLAPYCFNYAAYIAFAVLFGFTAGLHVFANISLKCQTFLKRLLEGLVQTLKSQRLLTYLMFRSRTFCVSLNTRFIISHITFWNTCVETTNIMHDAF